MKKKTLFSFWLLFAVGTTSIMFSSCAKDDDPKKENNQNDQDSSLTTDVGVVINGVKWATRNVDAPGKFTATSTDFGTFYQWNRKTAWPSTGNVSGWDATNSDGTIWKKSNDPSPSGWRIPTPDEIIKLMNTDKVTNEWTTENGVNGRKFTDKTTGNILFLPAAGYRYYENSLLGGSGLNGNYWGNMQSDSANAYCIGFHDSSASRYYALRSNGLSIRAVAE